MENDKKVFRELSKSYVKHLNITDAEQRLKQSINEIENKLRVSNNSYAMLERIERMESKVKQLENDIMNLTWK